MAKLHCFWKLCVFIIFINLQIPDEPFHSYAAECKHPQFKKILTLFEYVDQQYSTFELYPDIDEFLDVKILTRTIAVTALLEK